MPERLRLHDDVMVDLPRRLVVQPDGSTHRLTPIEGEVLAYLSARPGQVVTYEELLVDVWGFREGHPRGVVQTCLSRLRRLIGDTSDEPRHIFTSRGRGYRFEPRADLPAFGAEPGPTSIPEPRPVVEAAPELVGRVAELSRLRDELDTPGLVTLWGPAGSGKTALALNVARSHEVGVVRLERARDSEEVFAAIAARLGLPAGPAGVARVRGALERPGALVVLDNAEPHLDTLVELLVDLPLGRAVLLTSREPLRLAHERVHAVGVLPADDAARLLVRRAGERSHPVPGTSLAVKLVQAVDGLPLAVELVAGWLGTLRPEELLRWLRRDPHQVDSDERDRDPGRVSLSAALERSWTLLSRQDREMLLVCATFAGPVEPAALDAISDHAGSLRAVRSLTRQALLPPPDATGRLPWLAVVRGWARDRLGRQAHAPELLRRHASWFAQHAGSASLAWGIERIDDLRQAQDTLLQAPDDAPLHDLTLLLDQVLARHGSTDERVDRLRRYRCALAPTQSRARCRGLLREADALQVAGQADRAIVVLDQAADLADTPALRAELLLNRGSLALVAGEHAAAESALQQALPLADDPVMIGRLWRALGRLHSRTGDMERALSAHEASLAAFARGGAVGWQAVQRAALAVVIADRGALDRAEAVASMAVGPLRRLDHRAELAEALQVRGAIRCALGDLDGAEADIDEARRLCEALGLAAIALVCREIGASLLRDRGALERAAESFQALAGAYRASGNGWGEARCTAAVGEVRLAQRDLAGARTWLARGAALHDQEGSARGWAHARAYLAVARVLAREPLSDDERDTLVEAVEAAFGRALARSWVLTLDTAQTIADPAASAQDIEARLARIEEDLKDDVVGTLGGMLAVLRTFADAR